MNITVMLLQLLPLFIWVGIGTLITVLIVKSQKKKKQLNSSEEINKMNIDDL